MPTGAEIAMCPSAQLVMSGQDRSQQGGFAAVCISDAAAFCAWQGMCAVAVGPPTASVGDLCGAADTAKPCTRSTSPSSTLSNVRQRFIAAMTLSAGCKFRNLAHA